jgi:hypothetical protein
MNPVSEQIDERILRLLGLEDVFDLDYDTYLTLLKEAIIVSKGKIPQEELAILSNERKRVRGKKGRFKPRKEKITADKVSTTKFLRPSKSKKTLALPPASISQPDSPNNLSGILKPLQSIAKTLALILKFNKKNNEESRKDKESEKRTKREEGLEGFRKGISAVSSAAKKFIAPFQSIIDRIWRFIFFTLLGRAFTQLMEWLGDPKNKKKIEVLGRFLKDWWPALAFAAGLFLTPFGGFIRSTIKLLRGFIPQILKIIPRLTAFAAANPVATAATVAAIGGTVGGIVAEKNLKKVDETLLQRRVQESKDKGKPLSPQDIERIRTEQLQKRIQDIRGTNIPGSAFASGGVIPKLSMSGMNFGTGYDGIDRSTGERVNGFGPDTQAIIAQPGEIVINKKTVDAMGPGYFLGLNRQYGGPGANKPKMGKMFNTGGMVGKPKSSDEIQMMINQMLPQTLKDYYEQVEYGFVQPMSPEDTIREIERQKRDVLMKALRDQYLYYGKKGGGLIKLQGGGEARKAWDSIPGYSLSDSIEDAQRNILNRQAKRNTSSIPFTNRGPKLPGNSLTERKYNMPGYNLKRWLDNYKTSPSYKKPGVNRPLLLQGGGEVDALERTYKQGQRSGASSEVLEAIGSEAFLLRHFGPG